MRVRRSTDLGALVAERRDENGPSTQRGERDCRVGSRSTGRDELRTRRDLLVHRGRCRDAMDHVERRESDEDAAGRCHYRPARSESVGSVAPVMSATTSDILRCFGSTTPARLPRR